MVLGPPELSELIVSALHAAIAKDQLELADPPTQVEVSRPKKREHGDYATNIALVLAKPAGRAPREIAQILAAELEQVPEFAAVDIAGPGFINIKLATETQGKLAQQIVRAGTQYGVTSTLAGERINLEFISANPTGPLHLGHTRWAAVGDALARILAAAGAQVTSEFYINDRGSQMQRFGESLAARAVGESVPEDGYQGDYIADLAQEIVAEHPEFLELDGVERDNAFREAGYELQLAQQQAVLRTFRTNFAVWSSERELHETGAVERGMTRLREQGHVFELDGAVWLRTTDFGDDKDRVLVKENGDLTYFASDTAYYVDKRDRGFDRAIYLLGADHHGYVMRLRAVAACAGDDPDTNIEVLIGQLVKIMRSGEEVRLSKRAGNIVTLEDLVDEVGVDAARYTLIRYPSDSPIVMDLDLLVQRTNDNPVFYVQYAHARISSVLRQAADLGIVGPEPSRWDEQAFHAANLSEPAENDLLGVLAEFPRIVAAAAELREPHRVARYLEDVATKYHKFYDNCRVLPRAGEEVTPTTIARLWLCAAARQTVANGLDLLGVTAPERM